MTSSINVYQCRLCLKRTPTRVNIYRGDFPKMLEVLTSIKVQENDGLPRYSCSKCAQEVKTALLVKKRILKAHKILQERIQAKQKSFQEKAADIGAIESVFSIRDQEIIPNTNTFVQKSFGETQETNLNSTNDTQEQTPIEFVNIADEEIKIEQEELIDTANDSCSIGRMQENSLDESLNNFHKAKYKKTKCHICSRLIKSNNIKKHIRLHSAGPSVCQICGVTCKNFESLRGHIFNQHKSSPKQYECKECGQGFRFKDKLRLHKKKAHMGLRNFKCETCGKGFFTYGNLMTHVRKIHEKLKPHVCEFCKTGFSSTYALKTHKRQHTNEKPYVCFFCEEGFRHNASLRLHLKRKHGVVESKGFVCKTCSKGFATNYALKVHERYHMSEKCEVCSETFSGEYLKNHLKEVHNIIKNDPAEDEHVTN
ncbi:uncharacterized protein isoform X1 [Leptinotarsa decemlineata]|uniref:uncharacterized protein isoform X1 n=1 Tax=Leptinotarsa decemlineata TaxID=7539 RepID=UPI003D30B7A7